MARVKKSDNPPAIRLDSVGIDVICRYVANGDSLRSWAKENGFDHATVLYWINSDEERIKQYAQARTDRADTFFDELDEVSQMAVEAETAVQVAGLRLKADNIKWKLARMNAKKYGEKIDTTISGSLAVTMKPEDLTDEQLATIAASNLTNGGK